MKKGGLMKPYLLGIGVGTVPAKSRFLIETVKCYHRPMEVFGILSQTGLGRTKSGGVVGCSVLGGERGIAKR